MGSAGLTTLSAAALLTARGGGGGGVSASDAAAAASMAAMAEVEPGAGMPWSTSTEAQLLVNPHAGNGLAAAIAAAGV